MIRSSTRRLPLTRISLYYLFTYLALTGLGLMFFPSATLRLLQSNATDGQDMARFAGILMLTIALLVSQIIRHSLDVLYAATVVIRLLIWAYVAWLYRHSNNPFFAVVLAVLGIGILLTGWAYISESRVTFRADG